MHSAPPATAQDRSLTRLARSASTPNGRQATAATSAVTVVSRPSSVFPIPNAVSSWRARAPTLPMLAPWTARTPASNSTTRRRAGPPALSVTRSTSVERSAWADSRGRRHYSYPQARFGELARKTIRFQNLPRRRREAWLTAGRS